MAILIATTKTHQTDITHGYSCNICELSKLIEKLIACRYELAKQIYADCDHWKRSAMEIYCHDEGTARVFSLKGRLEFGDFPDSSQVLEALETESISQVIIDLTELEFMDSAGVGLLIGFNKSVAEKGKTVVLRGASGAVAELLELFQLDTVFDIR
jgi:HptB-dependent secretion and biofilm anti anti-sigma factor